MMQKIDRFNAVIGGGCTGGLLTAFSGELWPLPVGLLVGALLQFYLAYMLKHFG